MKLSLIVLSLIASTPAFAKTTVLTGAKAQTMMESLAGAGFDVKNVDKEWDTLKDPISIETGAFVCHFDAQFPDGWKVNATCHKGALGQPQGDELRNPLALAQAIQPVSLEDDGLGNRWLYVDNIECSLAYKTHAYRCVATVKEQ